MKNHPGDICPGSFGSLGNITIVTFLVRPAYRSVLGLLAALLFFSYAGAVSGEALPAPGLQPVYRINLRVHLANSSRAPEEFEPIFSEINKIWYTQAGICFEIHTVDHDTTLNDGLDMWFAPEIGGYNGYYDGEYIQMSDAPVLAPAENPAKSSAARTAAHELGHALDLPHRQESDDNLMRSRTYGWQLSAQEIQHARETAADIAIEDTFPLNCGSPKRGDFR
ncbi:MAG: hypothetical protein WBW79_17405 [Desulfocapsaceae bacterium]|jgi:hypothetical protein